MRVFSGLSLSFSFVSRNFSIRFFHFSALDLVFVINTRRVARGNHTTQALAEPDLNLSAHHGSHHPAVGLIPIFQWTKSLGSRLAMFPKKFSALVLWVSSVLYFLRAH